MGNEARQRKIIYQKRKYYYVTYPSSTGPVSTLEWEAFVKGEQDLRYCYLVKELVTDLEKKGQQKLAGQIENEFNDRLKQLSKYYPANRLGSYREYELKLSRSIESFRQWILDTWQRHAK